MCDRKPKVAERGSETGGKPDKSLKREAGAENQLWEIKSGTGRTKRRAGKSRKDSADGT